MPIGRDELGVDVLDAAVRLLGCSVEADTPEGTVAVRLVEVEAYRGADDPASHSFRGRTARNAVMFGPPGHLYVYFVYGMHYCANLVTGPEGDPGAVLLRAGEVVDGIDVARERRPSSSDRDLARGPARLCRVLGIDLSDNGTGPDLRPGEEPAQISTGPRVGLRLAADRPWRFWVTGDPTVSTYRPAAPRRSAGR